MRATDLAAHFPADTLVYLETRDLGMSAEPRPEALRRSSERRHGRPRIHVPVLGIERPAEEAVRHRAGHQFRDFVGSEQPRRSLQLPLTGAPLLR